MKKLKSVFACLFCIMVASLGLVGCGKKKDPTPPPSGTVTAQEEILKVLQVLKTTNHNVGVKMADGPEDDIDESEAMLFVVSFDGAAQRIAYLDGTDGTSIKATEIREFKKVDGSFKYEYTDYTLPEDDGGQITYTANDDITVLEGKEQNQTNLDIAKAVALGGEEIYILPESVIYFCTETDVTKALGLANGVVTYSIEGSAGNYVIKTNLKDTTGELNATLTVQNDRLTQIVLKMKAPGQVDEATFKIDVTYDVTNTYVPEGLSRSSATAGE